LQAYQSNLLQQRESIDRQLVTVRAALETMGQPAPALAVRAPAASRGPGRGRRGPREGSLKTFILRVMKGGGVMAVKDITDAVRKAGYPTSNKTLAKSVGAALTSTAGVSRVGRGKFRMA
jgi:hypothetical protein